MSRMPVLRVPIVSGSTNKLYHDALSAGANGGLMFVGDTGSFYSWPTQAAPVNGSAVINSNESGSNGSVVVGAGGAPLYAGGGFDYSPVSAVGTFMQGDGSFATALAADANQYFAVCMYVKLPTLANWLTTGGCTILTFSQSSGRYNTVPEIIEVTVGQSTGTRYFIVNRQTAVGTIEATNLAAIASDYGAIAQILYWRNAAGHGLQVQTAAGARASTGANGAANTASLAGLTARFGIPPNGGVSTTSQMRFYRMWLEELTTSGRNPQTVAAADWTRFNARGVFS